MFDHWRRGYVDPTVTMHTCLRPVMVTPMVGKGNRVAVSISIDLANGSRCSPPYHTLVGTCLGVRPNMTKRKLRPQISGQKKTNFVFECARGCQGMVLQLVFNPVAYLQYGDPVSSSSTSHLFSKGELSSTRSCGRGPCGTSCTCMLQTC